MDKLSANEKKAQGSFLTTTWPVFRSESWKSFLTLLRQRRTSFPSVPCNEVCPILANGMWLGWKAGMKGFQQEAQLGKWKVRIWNIACLFFPDCSKEYVRFAWRCALKRLGCSAHFVRIHITTEVDLLKGHNLAEQFRVGLQMTRCLVGTNSSFRHWPTREGKK